MPMLCRPCYLPTYAVGNKPTGCGCRARMPCTLYAPQNARRRHAARGYPIPPCYPTPRPAEMNTSPTPYFARKAPKRGAGAYFTPTPHRNAGKPEIPRHGGIFAPPHIRAPCGV